MAELAAGDVHHYEGALAHAQGGSHGTAHARVIALLGLEFVHNKLDKVGFVAVERLHIVKIADDRVHPHLGVTLLAQLVEELAVVAFPPSHQRREQQAALAAEGFHYQLYYLGIGEAHHLLARQGRVGRGGLGVEKPQEVGHFGDGADGRAGIVARRFLFYGDDGAQTRNTLNLRLFKYAHKVFGIGREGVQVAPLPLGVDGVEGKRGLAASAQSRDYHELAARDVHVDVFQVMRLCPPYLDLSFVVHKADKFTIFS